MPTPGRRRTSTRGDFDSRVLHRPCQTFADMQCSFRLFHLTFLPSFCPRPGSDLPCVLNALLALTSLFFSYHRCFLKKSPTYLIPSWLLRVPALIQSPDFGRLISTVTMTIHPVVSWHTSKKWLHYNQTLRLGLWTSRGLAFAFSGISFPLCWLCYGHTSLLVIFCPAG